MYKGQLELGAASSGAPQVTVHGLVHVEHHPPTRVVLRWRSSPEADLIADSLVALVSHADVSMRSLSIRVDCCGAGSSKRHKHDGSAGHGHAHDHDHDHGAAEGTTEGSVERAAVVAGVAGSGSAPEVGLGGTASVVGVAAEEGDPPPPALRALWAALSTA